ncbi:MAG: RNA 2'-phosphotransferase, partial [Deltaproteobacteria bacterium]|nr:RNA 2'-phosphotransferase [Deltaproteobacteria bacterium]
MGKKEKKATSKFLSYVLRHRPDAIDIELDKSGWVDVDVLLRQCRAHNRPIKREELLEIVATDSKNRYALSDDGNRIRANQGHSVDVDLNYQPSKPPDVLYHGTVDRFLTAITEEGLRRMQRHHVHLSPDRATASNVGGRRGKPIILRIDAGRMHAEGHCFFLSENGVWLTDHVPP